MFMSSENQLQAQRWRIASDPTNYLYDGMNSLEEVDTAANILARYAQGEDLDEPLTMLRGGTASYYQADGVGSITSLSSTAGALAQSYTFDSFGKTTSTSGLVNPFQYTGRESDPEIGLYYYRARYYDSSTGRFIGEDPIGFISGNNFYAYAMGNPGLLVDPLGLWVEITFDRQSGTLTARDVDTNESVRVPNVYSGNGMYTNDSAYESLLDSGPLPGGTYLVGNGFTERDHPGDSWWYHLYGPDGKGGYSYTDIPVRNPRTGETVHRGLFNLHTGRASDGCVTVMSDVDRSDPSYPKSKAYDRLKRLLDNTKPLRYKGSTYRGWLHVR